MPHHLTSMQYVFPQTTPHSNPRRYGVKKDRPCVYVPVSVFVCQHTRNPHTAGRYNDYAACARIRSIGSCGGVCWPSGLVHARALLSIAPRADDACARTYAGIHADAERVSPRARTAMGERRMGSGPTSARCSTQKTTGKCETRLGRVNIYDYRFVRTRACQHRRAGNVD